MIKKSKLEKEADKEVDIIDSVLSVELPENLTKFIGLSTKEELVGLYQEQLNKLAGKVNASDLEDMAITAVVNEMRKEKKRVEFTNKPKAEYTQVVGFICGDSGIWDKILNITNSAQNYVKKHNIPEAIAMNYINGDGVILDRREKIFGKPNDGYLKPLKEGVSDCSRTLYLIGRLGEYPKYKYGTITSNDAALCRGWEKASQHQFLPCNTFGIIKEIVRPHSNLMPVKQKKLHQCSRLSMKIWIVVRYLWMLLHHNSQR